MNDISFVVVGINAHFDNGVSLNVAVGPTVEAVEKSLADRNASFASLVVSKKLFDKGFGVGAAGTLPAEIKIGNARTGGGHFQRLVPSGRPVMTRLGGVALDDWDTTNVES